MANFTEAQAEASKLQSAKKEFLDGKLKIKKTPREHVLQHTSYQRYSNDAYKLLEKYC